MLVFCVLLFFISAPHGRFHVIIKHIDISSQLSNVLGRFHVLNDSPHTRAFSSALCTCRRGSLGTYIAFCFVQQSLQAAMSLRPSRHSLKQLKFVLPGGLVTYLLDTINRLLELVSGEVKGDGRNYSSWAKYVTTLLGFGKTGNNRALHVGSSESTEPPRKSQLPLER
jgi:hypothetical protein